MKKIIFLISSFIIIYAQDAFVSAKELRNSFDNEKLVVIDVSDRYKIGHIDGSISFDVKYLINKEKSYMALKSHTRLLEIFSDIGLRDDSNIVIYGRTGLKDFKYCTFLAFTLMSTGFKKVSILDGGYMSWVFEYDSLIIKDVRALQKASVNLQAVDMIVDAKYIIENKNKINLIDARQRYLYDFSHISGATSCSYSLKFKRDYTILPVEDIKYICLGYLRDTSSIIVYSDDIFTSSAEWYILSRVLGFTNTKIYYNSFGEYKDLDLEISSYKQ